MTTHSLRVFSKESLLRLNIKARHNTPESLNANLIMKIHPERSMKWAYCQCQFHSIHASYVEGLAAMQGRLTPFSGGNRPPFFWRLTIWASGYDDLNKGEQAGSHTSKKGAVQYHRYFMVCWESKSGIAEVQHSASRLVAVQVNFSSCQDNQCSLHLCCIQGGAEAEIALDVHHHGWWARMAICKQHQAFKMQQLVSVLYGRAAQAKVTWNML